MRCERYERSAKIVTRAQDTVAASDFPSEFRTSANAILKPSNIGSPFLERSEHSVLYSAVMKYRILRWNASLGERAPPFISILFLWAVRLARKLIGLALPGSSQIRPTSLIQTFLPIGTTLSHGAGYNG